MKVTETTPPTKRIFAIEGLTRSELLDLREIMNKHSHETAANLVRAINSLLYPGPI